MSTFQAVDYKNRILKLLDEAYDTRINNLEKSIQLVEEALVLSKEYKDSDLTARGLSHLSLFYMIKGAYEDSITYADEAIEIFQELKDDKGVADAKYNIAGVYYKTDNYHLGLIHLIDCLTVYRKYHDFHNQSRVLKSIGTIYEYFGDEKSAIRSYEEAVEAGLKAGDQNLQSNAFNPLSGIYLNQGKIQKAMDLIERSINMKRQTGDIRGLAFALYGRGKVYTKMKLWAPSEQDFRKSIDIHEEMGEKLGVGMCYHKLGALYIEMGRFDDARKVLNIALDFASENRIIIIEFKANLLLYDIARKESKPREALAHLERYLKVKESVINTHTLKVIESYEAISRVEALEKEAVNQREKAEIIERKNKELDSFFYRISHDLKGPITSMIGLDHRVREEITDQATLRFFDNYISQVHRINNILDDLMKFTKMNHETVDLRLIDFQALIDDCISGFEYLPNFSKIDFKKVISPELAFKAEWSHVHTIFNNLIENSIKYARVEQPRPIVKISVIKIKDHLKIEILDNGIGMDEDTRDNIFNMFYQANEVVDGTGLGLYILYRTVEKLEGNIEMESEEGKGSIFTVMLPYSE